MNPEKLCFDNGYLVLELLDCFPFVIMDDSGCGNRHFLARILWRCALFGQQKFLFMLAISQPVSCGTPESSNMGSERCHCINCELNGTLLMMISFQNCFQVILMYICSLKCNSFYITGV